jgi:hypothetical protein
LVALIGRLLDHVEGRDEPHIAADELGEVPTEIRAHLALEAHIMPDTCYVTWAITRPITTDDLTTSAT